MTKRPRIIVSLNESTVRILEFEADRRKISKSQIIKEAVYEYMIKNGWQIKDRINDYFE